MTKILWRINDRLGREVARLAWSLSYLIIVFLLFDAFFVNTACS